MSIFPRRIKPSTHFIVHIRSPLKTGFPPHFHWVRIVIVDPNGKRQILRQTSLLKVPDSHEINFKWKKLHEDIFTNSPPAVFAEHLLQEPAASQWFLNFTREFSKAIHYYTPCFIPEKAPLGKYHVHLDFITEGALGHCVTEQTDNVYVEKIALLGIKAQKGKTFLLAQNLSPEPCPIVVKERVSKFASPLRFRSKKLTLKGGSITPIPVRAHQVFVTYLFGNETLSCNQSGTPQVLRNPSFQYTDFPLKKELLIAPVDASESNPPFRLTEYARDIWLSANGFFSKREIRTRRNAKTYDQMLKRKLILEIVFK